MLYNIYYIDDDADDQEMFKNAVSAISDHVELTIRENGFELLTALNSTHSYPNVIFLDLNMPVKNGYEVLKEIRASEKIKNLPVIIFTTADHADAIEVARKLGASLYISKPSTFSSLKNIVKYVLSINWETFIPTENEFVYKPN